MLCIYILCIYSHTYKFISTYHYGPNYYLCIWVINYFLIHNFISLILLKSTTVASSRTSDFPSPLSFSHTAHPPTSIVRPQVSRNISTLFIQEIRSKYLFSLEIHRKNCYLLYTFKENSCLIKKLLVNTCLF
jgi:hypothetical protein